MLDRKDEMILKQEAVIIEALSLIKQAFNYVNAHYERSVGSTGESAKKLKNKMVEFLNKNGGN